MRVDLDKAVKLLQMGEVVAIPTETVYGLAAPLYLESAIEKVFRFKKRPSHNPLIIHVADWQECLEFCSALPDGFEKLAKALWPGPLTLVLPIHEGRVPSIVRANLPTTAFRMPSHSTTQALLRQVGPLVAPSANISGSPSSTRPEHVESDFGRDFPVLDGGACQKGVESTICVYKDGLWQIARLGALSPESISHVLGYTLTQVVATEDQVICPGQLLKHYAPKAHLVLSKASYALCSNRLPAVLGFSDGNYLGAERVVSLGSRSDPLEVASQLYDALRELDRQGIQEAWVDMDFPQFGVWLTILERLSRAASR